MKRFIVLICLLFACHLLFAEVLFNRKIDNREFKIEKEADFHLLTTLEETEIKGNYICCVIKLLNCTKNDIAELIMILSEEEKYFELFDNLYQKKQEGIKKIGEDVDFNNDKLIEYYFYEIDIK